jgi:hypothetical protein
MFGYTELMNASEIAAKYAVPILNQQSKFPEYFAVHSMADQQTIENEFLRAPSSAMDYNLTSSIDSYYIFFSLGKGYLSSCDGWGLIYDPFELVASNGANLVKNDLLYILDQSSIIPDFCLENKQNLNTILETDNLSPDLIINDQAAIFWRAIGCGQSLLIVNPNDSPQYQAGMIFDTLLQRLSEPLAAKLRVRIREEVTVPNTQTSDLDAVIRLIFAQKKSFLNTFSNKTDIEEMPEIRVPNSHPIGQGLIAVYDSKRVD